MGGIVAAGAGGGFAITRPLLVGTGRGETPGALPGGIIGTVLGAIDADALALGAMLADAEATGACEALAEPSVRVRGDSAWISSLGGRAQASRTKGAPSAADASANWSAAAVGSRPVPAAARSERGVQGACDVASEVGRFRRVSIIVAIPASR
jgi:hypothetical protein